MLTPKERAGALLSRLNVEIRVNAQEIEAEIERAIEHAMRASAGAEREACALLVEALYNELHPSLQASAATREIYADIAERIRERENT
jgi:ribosomal protein L17